MRPACRSHLSWLAVVALLLADAALAAPADRSEEKPQPVPEAEYRLYDLVIQKKFLTSQTELVVIERLTVVKLGPGEQDIPSQTFFDGNQFFGGRLRQDLVTDFIIKNVKPSKLEGRFRLGVRYRFLSNGQLEEPEVFLAPIPVSRLPYGGELSPVQSAGSVVGAIGFSRIGFSQSGEQALVYVSDDRQDGTGAGFLFLLGRKGREWDFVDSEVVWFAQREEPAPPER